MDNLDSMICVSDLDYNLLFVNKQLADTFDMDRKSCIGQKCYKATRKKDAPCIFCQMPEIKSYKDSLPSKKYEYMWDDYLNKWISGTDSIIRWVDGSTVFFRSVRDSSQQKEQEELLQESIRVAETASAAKSSFLANMSHEIRTPMNAILGIAEIELMNEKHDSGIRAALEKIYSSGDLLLSIINDILDLSKIEAGKLELTIDKYEIASLISDTAQLNMMRIGSKQIEFELHIDENMPAQMLGDVLRVKQILNNLLSNAFKYTEAGKVTLSVTAQPCEKYNDKTIMVVSVNDTGQGMTKEQVDELFNEYSRFNQDANRLTEGTGLGMSITNNLVNIMDGGISVESELGKGSTFTVRLPQGVVDAGALGKEIAENLKRFRLDNKAQLRNVQISRDPMPYGNVLIVDDVDTNIYVAKGLMAPYDLKTDSADSGFAAIEKIKSGRSYDIIFMDHMMPKMDGVETTKRIRDLGYTEPIVALTANAVTGQVDIFLQNGFDDFISKPIDIRYLNSMLNKFIRDKQPPEVIEEARRQAEEKKKQVDEGGLRLLLKKEIAGLNIFDGIAQFGGNEDSYLNVLRAYTASTRRLLATIDTGENEIIEDLSNDETNSYEITVHAIKGSSYSVCANSLGKLAENLESAAKAKDWDYISKHNTPFIEAAFELVNNLDALFSSLESNAPKPKKDKPDKDILSKLLTACDVFDMGEVEALMKEINNYQYEADNGLADWLQKNVELVNFDEIVDKLKEELK
jgi:signal transduction histidine kinase/FixJ family two-component response regulator/HPt (histidine-containing phosphotransfer) domain-containing protein